MSDLASDPVFGEVARALSARGLTALNRFPHSFTLEFSVRSKGIASDTFDFTDVWLDEHGNPEGFTIRPAGVDRMIVAISEGHLAADSVLFDAAAALFDAYMNRNRPLAPVRTMGIVNVTPDSFSDSGDSLDPSRAVDRALALVAEGAGLLDIGGESTRPRSEPVSLEEELRRVVPVITALAKRTHVPISIDTTKSAVARAALDAGATIVNDVSAGLADDAMLAVVAKHGAGYVAMHMQGDPRTMQDAPRYDDVVAEVTDFLRERCFCALDAGVPRETLWIDPGIGFGKTLEHNLELLRRLPELRSLGLPILLGVSRKAFITKITGVDTPPAQRIGGTAAAIALGVVGGAEILRVHDVAVMREAALVARAIGLPG